MPGFNIHLAIGKRYIEKQKNKKDVIKNENSFYNGLVAPDLVNDKKISHYTTETNKNNLEKYLLGKVRLDLYLKDNKVETDFEKGVFLHLLTDYLFFNKFFEKEFIKNIDYQDFVRDLYYSYEMTNEYLNKKYNIDFSIFGDRLEKNIRKNKKEKKLEDSDLKEKKLIFSEKDLDEFIEKISSINIKELENEIRRKI